MELKLLEKNDKIVRFLLKDSTVPFANALRRIMIAEVPTLAIEDVDFVKNDSVMYDEMIALRLGLIPLTTPLKKFNFRENCTCKGKGCSNCEVRFTLNKTGGTVYSKDLKSNHPEVKPISDKIPITKLGEGKSLKLEAIAILGRGKTHSKWQPGVIYYKSNGKDFEFYVETFGQLRPEEIVLKAAEILGEKCDEFAKELDKL